MTIKITMQKSNVVLVDVHGEHNGKFVSSSWEPADTSVQEDKQWDAIISVLPQITNKVVKDLQS